MRVHRRLQERKAERCRPNVQWNQLLKGSNDRLSRERPPQTCIFHHGGVQSTSTPHQPWPPCTRCHPPTAPGRSMFVAVETLWSVMSAANWAPWKSGRPDASPPPLSHRWRAPQCSRPPTSCWSELTLRPHDTLLSGSNLPEWAHAALCRPWSSKIKPHSHLASDTTAAVISLKGECERGLVRSWTPAWWSGGEPCWQDTTHNALPVVVPSSGRSKVLPPVTPLTGFTHVNGRWSDAHLQRGPSWSPHQPMSVLNSPKQPGNSADCARAGSLSCHPGRKPETQPSHPHKKMAKR